MICHSGLAQRLPLIKWSLITYLCENEWNSITLFSCVFVFVVMSNTILLLIASPHSNSQCQWTRRLMWNDLPNYWTEIRGETHTFHRNQRYSISHVKSNQKESIEIHYHIFSHNQITSWRCQVYKMEYQYCTRTLESTGPAKCQIYSYSVLSIHIGNEPTHNLASSKHYSQLVKLVKFPFINPQFDDRRADSYKRIQVPIPSAPVLFVAYRRWIVWCIGDNKVIKWSGLSY